MKDEFKRTNMVDYTAWDLNCKCIVDNHGKQHRLKKKFRRKARRKLKKVLDNLE